MAKVRLSIRPDQLTDIPDDEVPVLRAQGLLIEGEDGTRAPASGGEPDGDGGAGEEAS